jgi:hypothetical protein
MGYLKSGGMMKIVSKTFFGNKDIRKLGDNGKKS